MALTVITPNKLCFAKNPILVEARTDKILNKGESFLRIVCEVKVWGTDYMGNSINFENELSQPVESGGTAVFNLNDSVQAILQQSQKEVMDNDFNEDLGVVCEFRLYESWLFENQEYKGEPFPTLEDMNEKRQVIQAVPGGLTDYELLTMDSIDLTSLTVSGRFMTRKPDLGIVYRGEEVILPTLYSGGFGAEANMKVNGTQVDANTFAILQNHISYQNLTASGTADGELVFTSNRGGVKSGWYRANNNGVHFLRFVNGFGAVENIAVRAKDKLTYEVGGEMHSLVQEASVRPTDRRYAIKKQPVGVYDLSSGYVPKQWAEWYVQELLTSPKVWILLGGHWVPALIEAEDDCVIYDRTKPEMPHVDFTLRLAIDGVTGATW